MSRPAATRAEFKAWRKLTTRWADNDAYGHVNNTVYYEWFDDIRTAIQRERTMKHWSRAWKVRLIHAMNPEWDDLSETLNQWRCPLHQHRRHART